MLQYSLERVEKNKIVDELRWQGMWDTGNPARFDGHVTSVRTDKIEADITSGMGELSKQVPDQEMPAHFLPDALMFEKSSTTRSTTSTRMTWLCTSHSSTKSHEIRQQQKKKSWTGISLNQFPVWTWS